MPLTPEQEAQIEMQVAIQSRVHASMSERQYAEAVRIRKYELLRLAQQMIVDNKRGLPVQDRQITPEEIISFADRLIDYVES